MAEKERYIRMSHRCYEALYTLPMSDGERRVLMMIIRYTVGFHRYTCDFSDRYAASVLGITHQRVGRCIRGLRDKKYIYIISPGCGSIPRKIGLNYKQISGNFATLQRQLCDTADSKNDAICGNLELPKKIKEKKNQEKKNKERFASEPSSLFSQDSPGSGEEEPDEEWWELHKDDDE